jgi:hypothetical protein
MMRHLHMGANEKDEQTCVHNIYIYSFPWLGTIPIRVGQIKRILVGKFIPRAHAS